MRLMSRPLQALDAVDWGSLTGAYGLSLARAEGADGAANVAAQLRGLVSEDEDAFEDALWGGLAAHVWHQGDIYEVSPLVVPFIVGIVDDPAVARRGDVAGFLVNLGESACRYVRSDDGEQRALGQRTCRALLDDARSIERWWRDEDDGVAEAGVTLAWLLEELRVALVEHLKTLPRPPSATELTALALLPDARDEEWAVRIAARVVRDANAPRTARIAAALLLQLSRSRAPSEVDPFVDELTAPHERAALSTAFEVPGFAFPRRSEPAPIDAQVVFAGPGLFLARAVDGRQFTCRWPSSGLQKGDTVRLAQISTMGIARLVELRPGSADSRAIRFDERGLPIIRTP